MASRRRCFCCVWPLLIITMTSCLHHTGPTLAKSAPFKSWFSKGESGFSAPEFQCLRGGVVGRPRRYLWSLRSEEPFLGMQPTSQASLIIRISRIGLFRPSEGAQSFPAHFPRWILKLWRLTFACRILVWCIRGRRSAFFDFHSWCRAHVSLLRGHLFGPGRLDGLARDGRLPRWMSPRGRINR